jgi:hypothetical protein
MSFEAEPIHLLIDGPFTNAGLASLNGLEGLLGLSQQAGNIRPVLAPHPPL